jgi:MFS family permease
VANWAWLLNGVSLVVFGLVSDRLRVRKPLMIIGGVGSLAATLVFVSFATHHGTSAATLALTLGIQAAFGAMVFAPWMAAYTEMVEDRNPALMATGLAVWGGVLRVVVAVTTFFFPFVVPAVTPLADYGPQVIQYAAQYGPQVQTAEAIQPATLAAITRDPTNIQAVTTAVGQIASSLHVSQAAAVARLQALAVASSKVEFLALHAPAVEKASKQGPHQWQHWWFITAIGQMVFLSLVFLMVGPWTPAGGRKRDEEQERLLRGDAKPA